MLHVGITALTDLTSLTHLCVDEVYNECTVAASDLAITLPSLQHLRYLNVNGCTIGDSCAALHSLAQLTALTYLVVTKTAISESTVNDFAAALKQLKMLQVLHMGEDKLNTSANELACALSDKQELRVVVVEWCGLGRSGAEAIIRAVESLPCIEHLDLDGNVPEDDYYLVPKCSRKGRPNSEVVDPLFLHTWVMIGEFSDKYTSFDVDIMEALLQ